MLLPRRASRETKRARHATPRAASLQASASCMQRLMLEDVMKDCLQRLQWRPRQERRSWTRGGRWRREEKQGERLAGGGARGTFGGMEGAVEEERWKVDA